MQLLIGILNPYDDTETENVEEVQKTASMWACRRWRNTSSVDDMLGELEWPCLEDFRQKSSLTFIHKIHSGTVSLNKDKYLAWHPDKDILSYLLVHSTRDL